MEEHDAQAVLVQPRSGHFIGKELPERVRRVQFPLVLAWAKTVHESQGATEPHGVVATLNAKAAEEPGLACVALSRC
eukprot:1583441-Alexandrium_andersonii.AAC.1